MTDSSTESTSYVSIQADVHMDWRSLSERELEQANDTFSERSAAIGICSEIEYNKEALAPAVRKIRRDHPEIAAWLNFLQDTVSSLATQVSIQRNTQSGLSTKRVSISASGIEFNSTRPCAVGETIEVVLTLQPSYTNIMIVGDVTNVRSVNSSPETDSDLNRIKVDFILIRDSDQEVLIRHIHRAQLEELRNAREDRQERCEKPESEKSTR